MLLSSVRLSKSKNRMPTLLSSMFFSMPMLKMLDKYLYRSLYSILLNCCYIIIYSIANKIFCKLNVLFFCAEKVGKIALSKGLKLKSRGEN